MAKIRERKRRACKVRRDFRRFSPHIAMHLVAAAFQHVSERVLEISSLDASSACRSGMSNTRGIRLQQRQ